MSEIKIKLGQKVRDQITGVEGVATQRVDFMSGLSQFTVQPRTDDPSKIADAWNIDHHTLEVLNEDLTKLVIEPAENDLKLGQRVRDDVTGLIGVLERRCTYINGCVRYLVIPPHQQKGALSENSEGVWIDHKRLTYVGTGISESPKVVDAPTAKAPGGPMNRAASARASRG